MRLDPLICLMTSLSITILLLLLLRVVDVELPLYVTDVLSLSVYLLDILLSVYLFDILLCVYFADISASELSYNIIVCGQALTS